MTRPEIRCTYCRRVRPDSCFSGVGDHVIPASLGGVWIDRNTCDECNTAANRNADELVAKDPVVAFLRDPYAIRDRYGRLPPPSRITVRVPDGGVVHVTLGGSGPTYTPAMPPEVVSRLGLADASQERLQAFVASVLGFHPSSPVDSLILARAAQQIARTPEPPAAWSRFMAKIALACGREAYGDEWLDKPWAQILSGDLLGGGVPRFAQRDHHPPIEPTWPYEPPKHAIWIQPYKDTAVLYIVLFGQLHGGVPVNASDAEIDKPSAWTLDPVRRTFPRSTSQALHMAAAARAAEKAGATPVMVAHPDHPFVFIPDGPDGPVDLGVKLMRADSPAHALELLTDTGDESGD